MQATEAAIRQVVQEVLTQLGRGPYVASSGKSRDGAWGVFKTVDQAVEAATDAFHQLSERGLEDRRRAIDCVRKITSEQADELGRLELEETKIGRLDHKIEKLKIVRLVPGVEFLKTDCLSGDRGLTLTEYAPFGVIGAITPVTHSLPTLAGNVISMVAGGNTLVVNAHPGGARIAAEGVRRFNKAIYEATGLENLITIVEQPTLESAAAIFEHRGVRLLCVTGGPAVARAALESRKRAIVAGPGNPPVVVDESACLDNAARSIVKGAAYDNNLLCIGEKEVFAIDSIFTKLMEAVGRNGGYQLDSRQVEQLSSLAFKPGKDHPILNRDLIGKDATALAELIGVRAPAGTQLLYGETDESNPFVSEEQMMPFVPFIRIRDFRQGVELAKKYEHNFRHTAIIHSRNVRNMTVMGREMDTTLFIKNGPCMAGLGLGGEGFLSYSIATPTGEGVTSPLTFTRQRRCTLVDDLRVI
ncbi:MAG TPA: aldehyde dehydrogenase family protein [Planctomycetaceae bacterium]|nr:aldehyde dehydrogenase family protein [Planctomycetaceae bacterium]